MRLYRSCLVLMLMAGLAVPAVAQAGTAKLKTRIVYSGNTGADYYVVNWALDTTSVAPPVAKGRLMYYRSSTRKWVGYAHRPVAVTWGMAKSDHGVYPAGRFTTDSRGYFKFKMRAGVYTTKYSGSSHTRSAQRSVFREDEVRSPVSPAAIVTSSVDASNTRVSVAFDYRYNQFVTAGDHDVYTELWVGDPEDGVVYAVNGHDYVLARPGFGHQEFSYVLPTAMLEGKALGVDPSVGYYWGRYRVVGVK